MPDLSSQYRRVLVASEATYGTDAVNTVLTTNTADIIYQDVRQNFDIVPARVIVEIDRARGTQSGVAHQTIADRAVVTGDVALTGWISGDAGEERPFYDAFLRACGMKATVVSATSAVYRPQTAQQEGMTAYLYERNLDDDDWRLTYSTGIRGSANFQFGLNQEAFFSFSGVGKYNGLISDPAEFFDPATGEAALLKDGSTPVTARTTGVEQYANKTPMMCTSMNILIGGETFCVQSLNLDLGWNTAVKECIGASSNVQAVYNTRAPGSRIGGSFTLIDGGTAHDVVMDAFLAGSEISLALTLVEGDGSSGSARIQIAASKLQIGVPAKGDAGGVRNYAVPFFLNGNFADLLQDDDFSITYDEVP